MNPKISLDVDSFDAWRGFRCDLMSPPGTEMTSANFHGFGDDDRADGETSQLLSQEVLELFDAEGTENFFMGVPNQSRSSPTISPFATNSSSALPNLVKKEANSASDTSSPLPELILDIPGERRRAQNRTAQRAHRERQKRYVTQLEKRFVILQTNYNQLDEKYKTVQQEYQSLTSILRSRRTSTDSPLLQTSAEADLAVTSTELHLLNEFSLCEQELDRVLAFKVDETPSPEMRNR